VNTFPVVFDLALGVARNVVFVGAAAVGVLVVVEWASRTKRINPFSPPAQGARRLLAPLMAPVERRILRAGGTFASVPWWTLVAVIVGGVILLAILDFVRGQAMGIQWALNAGPRGIFRLLLRWTFALFYIAILIRVVSSWFRMNPFGRLVRWSYALSEPLLAPIRGVLPTFGMIDLSPLAAYFLLRVIEAFLFRVF